MNQEIYGSISKYKFKISNLNVKSLFPEANFGRS